MQEVIVFYSPLHEQYVSGYTHDNVSLLYCWTVEHALMFDPQSNWQIIHRRFELKAFTNLQIKRITV